MTFALRLPPALKPIQDDWLLEDPMEERRINVLLVGSDARVVRPIRVALALHSEAGVRLELADWLPDGLRRLRQGGIDVVLMALDLEDGPGLDDLEEVRATAGETPIVVITGRVDESLGRKALRRGAMDYLIKEQIDGDQLSRCLRYVIKRQRAEAVLQARDEEFRLARKIQEGLYPRAALALPDFDISGASFPANATGGDYFDYLSLCDGGVGLVVGDASGHGLGPALLSASTRAYLRALALEHAEAGIILSRANQLLADDISDEHFVTVFLGRLDPGNARFSYASAGHPTGYVLDSSGTVKETLRSTGLPLGVHPATSIPSAAELTLQRGDLMVLMTDGVLEARRKSGQRFGIERTLEVIRDQRTQSARTIVASLYQAVRDFSPAGPPQDDITALIIKKV